MASVSLAVPTVGPAENRSVTLVATPGAPINASKPVEIYWTTIKGTIPSGYQGGRGVATVVFAAGTFDPGTYNVKVVVVDPSDGSTAQADRTFVIPALPNAYPAAPIPVTVIS